MRRGIGYFVLMFVVGAVAGSAVGEILGHVAPNGPLHSILTRGTTIGIPHSTCGANEHRSRGEGREGSMSLPGIR